MVKLFDANFQNPKLELMHVFLITYLRALKCLGEMFGFSYTEHL